MSDSIRVLIVLGTRPEAIKMAPVVKALESLPEFSLHVCLTAQHRDMLDQVIEEFGLPVGSDLNLMESGQSLPDLTGRILAAMTRPLESFRPDLMLVHGDTTTTFAAALSACYARIKVGHVEAGLRTYNPQAPFPEEINRTLVAHMADLHFAPTPGAVQNLLHEGIDAAAIHHVGNTAIDALLWMKERIPDPVRIIRGHVPEYKAGRSLALITAHRRESFGEGFASICRALRILCEKHPETLFVYPVHPNPNVRKTVYEKLSNLDNMKLIEPLNYSHCVAFMSQASLILTDSGGIQEEAPSLGKKVLVLRDVTERWEAVEAGIALLVGSDCDRIVSQASPLLAMRTAETLPGRILNPYGDGHAAERIVDAILRDFGLGERFSRAPLPKNIQTV